MKGRRIQYGGKTIAGARRTHLREVGTTFVLLCETTRRLTRVARSKKKREKEKSFEEASEP